MKNITKYLVLLVSAVILTACSMEKLANKILPEPVKSHATQAVEAVLSKDAAFFKSMQGEKMSDEDFEKAVEGMFAAVSDGAEIRRDIVSASSEVNASLGNGTNKAYSLIYEIQTDDGFTAISLDYVQAPKMSECCRLNNINVVKSDTSPYRQMLETMAKIMKIAGLVLLLGLGLLIFFLVRWSRRKKSRLQAR